MLLHVYLLWLKEVWASLISMFGFWKFSNWMLLHLWRGTTVMMMTSVFFFLMYRPWMVDSSPSVARLVLSAESRGIWFRKWWNRIEEKWGWLDSGNLKKVKNKNGFFFCITKQYMVKPASAWVHHPHQKRKWPQAWVLIISVLCHYLHKTF